MANLISEAAARRLCARALGHVTAEAAEVHLTARNHSNTRAAANAITSSGDVTDTVATLAAQTGRRRATVTLNQTDNRSLAEAGQRLEALVEHAPEDPELLPPLEQPVYQPVGAFFQTTEELDAERRADAAAALVQRAAAAGLVASGFVDRQAVAKVVANSAGLFAYHQSTLASLTATFRTEEGDGSGWGGTTHNDWSRMISPDALADRVTERTQQSRGAADIEPGAYTVVLEPTAVGNLMTLLRPALDARIAAEGRSRFSRPGGGSLIGEQVADERLTLLSDPTDEDLLEPPFTDSGEPVGRTVWIEDGILRSLGYSRFWAEREGVNPVPIAGGLKLVGGEGDVQSLVSEVERGVLVTRFWDIQAVDPRLLQYTGLTRDGTFLIENGRVTGAVKNLRFNESLSGMLNRVEAVGASERVVASESGGLGPAVVAPPLVVRDFLFTTVLDAV
jgi:predicted Zn-dependent protease